VAPFGSSGMVSYSTTIPTMAVSHTVFQIHQPTYWSKSPTFLIILYSAPSLGVKQSELSNDPRCRKTIMMELSGGTRISTKSLAVLIQSTRVAQTDTQSEMP